MPAPFTLFFISPANLGGERGALLFKPGAQFPLATQLRSTEGAPLGDVFSFVSGLYFRGKRAYAETFGKAPDGLSPALVISPIEGLRFLYEPVTLERLRGWAQVDIDENNPLFTAPLVEHTTALARVLGQSARFVLLGSVATDKYVKPLGHVLGERLLFPPDFLGRGDMSRGSLLLRAARAGEELRYVPVAGSARHGPRPTPLGRARSRAQPGVSVKAPAPLARVADPSAESAVEPASEAREAPRLVILIGLPGAGKSTFYAEQLASRHDHVSRDLLRGARQPERLQETLVRQALRAGRSVVVDNTHVGVKDRTEWIALGRALGAHISGYFFAATARECVARNAGREGVARIPTVGIFAAARRLIAPTYAEGFDELFNVCTLDGRFETTRVARPL